MARVKVSIVKFKGIPHEREINDSLAEWQKSHQEREIISIGLSTDGYDGGGDWYYILITHRKKKESRSF